MVKRFLYLIILVILAVTACVDDVRTSNECQMMTFTASSVAGETKTVIVDRVKVYWEDGDAIAVSGASQPFTTSLTEPSPVAEFVGEATAADDYYAVYPYEAVNEWADEVVSLTLPDVQKAVKGSFDPDANIAVASANDEAKNFFFRNVTGLVKFTVGANTGRVTSVTISANCAEALAGDFLVDCSLEDPLAEPESKVSAVTLASEDVLGEGDYYIALLPGTYAEGLTFTLAGPEGTAVKEISRELSLERGHIQTVDLDGLTWVAEEAFYVEVAQTFEDWSGDYLITYDDGTSITVFNSWDANTFGQSSADLDAYWTEDGIPAEYGDSHKSVISKVGDSYSIYVSNVGYIGYTGTDNSLVRSGAAPTASDKAYLWNLSYKDGGSIWLKNAATTSRRLQWNLQHPRFACYKGSQEELTLYRRTTIAGPVAPQPDPDPTPDPDPDPTPDPDIPEPIPGISGKYSWYELPEISYTQSGSYLIDSSDENLYYAHHLCAGNEKGPGGKKARNYTVCFSAEHHCPVWVAAPRHTMYQSGASRTDAYAKDPSIPSDIQYNSKSTGGGCNKGHMLGSAERLSSTATNKQVFYYSNIAPQYSDTFNTGGGGWNILEDWVDGQVCSDTLYVVIGAYFDKYTDRRGNTGSPAKISFGGRSDVSRPTMFYYVLLRTKNGSTGKPLSQCTADEIKCAAFVRSHEIPKGTKVSEMDLMSVSDLEKITGFTYFPNVPQAPKGSYKASDWGL